jgi:hypothetical protein
MPRGPAASIGARCALPQGSRRPRSPPCDRWSRRTGRSRARPRGRWRPRCRCPVPPRPRWWPTSTAST